MESGTLEETLRSLAPWHFDIEVAPGVRTKDFNAEASSTVSSINPEEMVPLLETVLPGGVAGKSFLDVGCNGGGYCFVAHRLGASRAHGFDVRDHWINQANFIRSVLCPDAEGVSFQVADAKTFQHDGRFDITLFKGIFYHLPDPISVLRDVCDLTERAVIVDTGGRSDIPEAALIPWQESTTHLMSGVDGLAWFPGGPAAIEPILRWSGFRFMRTIQWRIGATKRPNSSRFRVVGFRERADYDAYSGPEYQPST